MSENVLPLPSIDFVPRQYSINPDAGTTALTNKLDELLERWEAMGLNLYYLKSPSRCPAALLPELAYLVGVTLNQSDSEQVRRQAIEFAVANHKKQFSFTRIVKPFLDSVTGASAAIVFPKTGFQTWMLRGDTTYPVPTYLFASLRGGAATAALFLGLKLCGSGQEWDVPGNIYIDLGVTSLTSDEQAEINNYFAANDLAYFNLFLGYISGEQFITLLSYT